MPVPISYDINIEIVNLQDRFCLDTNMLYKKLDLDLGSVDFERLKGKSFPFSRSFFEIQINDWDYLRSILKDRIRFKIRPDRINVTEITYPGAHPHVDAWTVALNYYFNTGSEATNFYKVREDGAKSKTHRDPQVLVYDLEDLEQIGQFSAEVGDCYLLDTKAIHAVGVNDPSAVRKIMRITWLKGSVEEIYESIEIL